MESSGAASSANNYYAATCGPLTFAQGEDRDVVRRDGVTNRSLTVSTKSVILLWMKDWQDVWRPVERFVNDKWEAV